MESSLVRIQNIRQDTDRQDNIMSIVDDTKRGLEIGRQNQRLYSWSACIDCGNKRWVQIKNGELRSQRCHACGICLASKHTTIKKRELSPFWRGGRRINPQGYIVLYISSDNPYFSMRTSGSSLSSGSILEHRLVMAQHLGRCLEPWEIIHHKNGIRSDNKIENLQIVLKGRHNGTVSCPYCQKEFGLA